ncbi:MAG: amino acid decarboxylase, partial [Thermoanaerobaculia bacterium]|nr:amino acid decarboxylase [Thermoanaerobaculia bacterium]
AVNRALAERLNAEGDLFLSTTELDGRHTLRLCVGQTRTERRHVEAAWRRVLTAAEALSS